MKWISVTIVFGFTSIFSGALAAEMLTVVEQIRYCEEYSSGDLSEKASVAREAGQELAKGNAHTKLKKTCDEKKGLLTIREVNSFWGMAEFQRPRNGVTGVVCVPCEAQATGECMSNPVEKTVKRVVQCAQDLPHCVVFEIFLAADLGPPF